MHFVLEVSKQLEEQYQSSDIAAGCLLGGCTRVVASKREYDTMSDARTQCQLLADKLLHNGQISQAEKLLETTAQYAAFQANIVLQTAVVVGECAQQTGPIC